ncbi:MAG: BglG family transcription antiterminator [Sarcina sp.]
MLNERKCTILRELNINTDTYINSNYLAEILGVSSRTVKRDIKEVIEVLEVNGATLDTSNQGYKILVNNEKRYNKYINKIFKSGDIISVKKDNVNKIVEMVLTNKFINQDRISDELFISRSTLSKLMTKVKSILTQYDILLNNKPHYGYVIEGNEVAIRNCMVKYLSDNDNENNIRISEFLYGFSEKKCNKLLEEITTIFKVQELNKTDIEISYITRYLIVSVFRCKNEFSINLDGNINISLDNIIIKSSKLIAVKAYEAFGVKLTFEDIIYIAYIIGNNSIDIKEKNNKEVSFKNIVIHCLEEINKIYGVNFFIDDILVKGLVSHLYTSCSRYYLNATLGNPLISMIKSKYIEAYNYSILCSKIFNKCYNIKISEEEIGYIALHFAASLERDIMNNNIKIIIICSSGIGTAELIKSRIIKKMPNISVVGVHPAYMLDVLELDNIDLVISTVNVSDINIEKEIINISPLLLNEDIEKINEYINMQKEFKYLLGLMNEDLFFNNINAETKEEVIELLCNELINKGLIDGQTMNSIIKREEISPTEINELVAIPHCILKTGENTVLAIGILNKPILWDKTYVQIVFLGALDPTVKENRKVFTILYNLTTRFEKVKLLVDSTDLIDFKKRLIK